MNDVRSSETPSLLAGRFRLGPLLGRGGMAEVYDGHDDRLQRPVAIKLLRSGAMARPDVRRRFEEEARSAARLVHPHAVAVFDSGEEDGVPFLVMERLPGDTLADRIAQGPLDLGEARRITTEVLSALGAAHRAGIVHRDIKPGNILLDDHGRAKVADFGIAKSLDVDVDLTSTDQVVGTPAYVAPERITGARAAPTADLYSTGVVLYEMLTGRKAFPGDNAVAVAYRVRHDEPAPVSELRPDVPASLARVVTRAMAKDPGRRFPSADAMAAALSETADTTVAVDLGDEDRRGPDATSVLPVVDVPVDAGHPYADAADPPPLHTRPRRGIAPLVRDVLHDRRVLAALGALALVLAVALLASVMAGSRHSASASSTGPAADLRSVASGLTTADGSMAPAAATRLRAVAGAVDAGKGGPEATALLHDVAAWRDRHLLTTAAADRIRAALDRVPGVDSSAFATTTTSTSLTPTTAVPAVAPAGRKGHGRKGKDG